MGGPLHLYFLGLTAIGFDSLWGQMVRNGTAQAIGQAKSTGVLASGAVLRSVYTGLPAVDRLLHAPVIFYDSLTHGRDPAYRALLVALFSSMQTISFSQLVLGLRSSRHPVWPFLENLFWAMFNQSHGAAFVYPLYFFTHLGQVTTAETPQGKHDQLDQLDEVDAEALVYTSVLAAVLPAWLIVTAYIPCSAETRQVLIASYRLTPAILSAAAPLLSRFLRAVRGWRHGAASCSTSCAARTRRLVKLSLVLSGAAAAIGHLYGVATGLLSSRVTLAAVFWPGATTNLQAGAAHVLTRGCHLFLQNDWWVIAAATAPYASAVIASSGAPCTDPGDSRGMGSWYEWAENVVASLGGKWVPLTFLTLLLSPGAVLAWSTAVTV
ncbi:hypothetical protein PgNI_06634 [Pyricularia grisea]|uniref:Uncharacterized protein n=1 Tax=Pyricularia grisea TaxID=148305 RepID=A0A6P8B5B5_PYRGI|nr:hypothetical protein PgNI_06634 [Pyricularia grisea]TLD10482.1 hypothetical protein PgNI_06634 [Pyricularia grisea]